MEQSDWSECYTITFKREVRVQIYEIVSLEITQARARGGV